MPNPQPKFTFLEQYILEVLAQNGLDNLNEELKKSYLPQLMVEAEYRLGLALMPKLNETQVDEFMAFVEKGADGEEMMKFWQAAVPDFQEQVKETLLKFSEEVSGILTKQGEA
ncbi:MAG TPA: DUF5663 domain-containing protein [Patescibacteria group bacterium]|nr:DUF5663 domain-containing protein [Patescibacteria group bacterium]